MEGGVMTLLSLVVGEKNNEIWIHFRQFLCICAKSHMETKRQKYDIISFVSTKYFNQNQSILL